MAKSHRSTWAGDERFFQSSQLELLSLGSLSLLGSPNSLEIALVVPFCMCV